MIRPFTALCVLLAGASGLYLYTEKHRTTVLDQQISRIVQDTQHIRERTAMLRAEWALLNQPDRLQTLATRFLPDLHPMAPEQFVQMASLVRRLPDVAAPAPVPAPMTVAAADPTVLAPLQVMARRITSVLNRSATEPSGVDETAVEPAADVDPPEAPRGLSKGMPRDGLKYQPPAHLMQLASSAPVAAGAHRPVSPRPHAQARPVVLLHPVAFAAASGRPVTHTVQASRMAVYEGGTVHGLLSSTSVYGHPASVRAAPLLTKAAWRPATSGAYAAGMPGASSASLTATRSSLGSSHVALPAPVPMQDGG